MTHRTHLAVAAALIATLAGCSSDGDDSTEGPIDGVQTGNPTSSQPSGSASAQPGPEDDIDRPDIELDDVLTITFEAKQSDNDAEEESILKDVEWQIKSVYEVVTANDLSRSSISFYTAGDALIDEMSFAQDIVGQGATDAGTMRYYDMEVTSRENGAAFVSLCRDFTDVETIDFETHEVLDPADPAALPTHYDYRVERNDEGVWQTTNIEYEQESPQCR